MAWWFYCFKIDSDELRQPLIYKRLRSRALRAKFSKLNLLLLKPQIDVSSYRVGGRELPRKRILNDDRIGRHGWCGRFN